MDTNAMMLNKAAKKGYILCSKCCKIYTNPEDANNCKCKVWTKEAILLLLDLVKSRSDILRDKSCKKSNIWNDISTELCSQGFSYTSIQAEKKWKNMGYAYWKFLNSKKIYGESTKRKPEYFDELEEALAECDNQFYDKKREQEKSEQVEILLEELEREEKGETHEEPSRWTRRAIRLLLDLVKTHSDVLKDKYCKKVRVWEDISTKLCSQGYLYTSFQARKKWNNMGTIYRNFMINQKDSGKSVKRLRKPEFFDELEEVLADCDIQFCNKKQKQGKNEQAQIVLEELEELELEEDEEELEKSEGELVKKQTPKEELSRWTRKAVRLLLDLLKAHSETSIINVIKDQSKSSSIWENISTELCSQGYSYTSLQTRKKWNQMRQTYQNFKISEKNSGESVRRSRKPEFFDELEEILTDRNKKQKQEKSEFVIRFFEELQEELDKNEVNNGESAKRRPEDFDKIEVLADCDSHFGNKKQKQDKNEQVQIVLEELENEEVEKVEGEPVKKETSQEDASHHRWSDEAVLLLLDMVRFYSDILGDRMSKKRSTWHTISDALNKQGHSVTSTQAEKKWNYLQHTYKDYLKYRKKIPRFFEEIGEILSETPTLITDPSLYWLHKKDEREFSDLRGQETEENIFSLEDLFTDEMEQKPPSKRVIPLSKVDSLIGTLQDMHRQNMKYQRYLVEMQRKQLEIQKNTLKAYEERTEIMKQFLEKDL